MKKLQRAPAPFNLHPELLAAIISRVSARYPAVSDWRLIELPTIDDDGDELDPVLQFSGRHPAREHRFGLIVPLTRELCEEYPEAMLNFVERQAVRKLNFLFSSETVSTSTLHIAAETFHGRPVD